MADATEMTAEGAEGAEAGELRPCAYCGASIHPASHRCPHCGGHVGMAWGTVHKEFFLFLFLAIVTAVGCLAPWSGRAPVVKTTVLTPPPPPAPPAAAPGAPAPAPRPAPVAAPEVKREVTKDVARMGGPRNGLDTLRGVFIFAIALYAVLTAILNALYRRNAMWPFVVNGFLCLWVGLQGVFTTLGSGAWGDWKEWAKQENYLEKAAAPLRAIPPGILLLAFVGVLTVFRLVAGILAAASKGKEAAAAAKETGAASRRRRGKDADGGKDAGAAGDA